MRWFLFVEGCSLSLEDFEQQVDIIGTVNWRNLFLYVLDRNLLVLTHRFELLLHDGKYLIVPFDLGFSGV